MKILIETCPFCGNNEFVKATQAGYGQVMGESWMSTSTLCHQICRDCGSVVRSYVDEPEKLLKSKNRKENL